MRIRYFETHLIISSLVLISLSENTTFKPFYYSYMLCERACDGHDLEFACHNESVPSDDSSCIIHGGKLGREVEERAAIAGHGL